MHKPLPEIQRRRDKQSTRASLTQQEHAAAIPACEIFMSVCVCVCVCFTSFDLAPFVGSVGKELFLGFLYPPHVEAWSVVAASFCRSFSKVLVVQVTCNIDL